MQALLLLSQYTRVTGNRQIMRRKRNFATYDCIFRLKSKSTTTKYICKSDNSPGEEQDKFCPMMKNVSGCHSCDGSPCITRSRMYTPIRLSCRRHLTLHAAAAAASYRSERSSIISGVPVQPMLNQATRCRRDQLGGKFAKWLASVFRKV